MLIDLQKAQPGMIITEDVINPRGGILIRKQQSLSADIINVLLRLGIREINVEDTISAPSLELILSEDLMSAKHLLSLHVPRILQISIPI